MVVGFRCCDAQLMLLRWMDKRSAESGNSIISTYALVEIEIEPIEAKLSEHIEPNNSLSC